MTEPVIAPAVADTLCPAFGLLPDPLEFIDRDSSRWHPFALHAEPPIEVAHLHDPYRFARLWERLLAVVRNPVQEHRNRHNCGMPWHARKKDPWYAIRTRTGPMGVVYRVSLCRAGHTVAKLFRARDHGSAQAALKAARQWRDAIAHELQPETKLAYSKRLLAHNTSGYPGVYLKHQVARRNGIEYEYLHWQAQSPAGARPFQSRSFSVDRYGYDNAYALAVQARDKLVADVSGYFGITHIPKRFRPNC